MGGRRRRGRVEHTDGWEQIELLCAWPEQRDYELIRPLVLFGDPVSERAEETGTSERTLYRRTSAFDLEGTEGLFGSETGKRRRLPPSMRRLVVDLKAEHPAPNLSEISRICYARFGRRPEERTVRRVLEEEPVPLRMIRRLPPYREIPEARERRAAVVALHAEGWTVKAIASYLRITRDTAYVALKRWIEEGLENRARGRYPATTWSAAGTNRLSSVARPRLFRTPYAAAQPRLFEFDEAGWLKALRLGEYAARDSARSAVCSPWRALGMPAAKLAAVRRSAARGCP